MINKNFNIISKSTITLLVLLVIGFLFYRNFSLYPSVMGDEYVNYTLSKNTNLKDMIIPSYIYFYFYKLSYVCDSNYLNCVRYLNILFFTFGIYFTYLLAKKFSNKNYSKIIFILLLVSPFNIYTAYFLPESMYYFLIWLTFYITFSLKVNKQYYFVIGFTLGLSSMIKPHAIFFVPVFIIYFTLLNKSLTKSFSNNSLFILSFFFIKLILSLFANLDFTIFGNYYSHAIRSYTDINFSELLKIINFSFINLYGIISFIVIIFCLPVLILIKNVGMYILKKNNYILDNFSLFVLIVLVFIIITYSIFSGFSAYNHIDKGIPFENSFRLNNRYYFFIFPLLLIVFLREMTNKYRINNNTNFIKLFSLMFIINTIFFGFNLYPSYHLVDAPLYRGVTYNNFFFNFAILFSIILIVLYNYKQKISLKIYLFIFLPIIFVFSSIPVNKEILTYKKPDTSQKIGSYLNEYFKSELNDNFLIIKINENKQYEINIYKILMAFETKNVSTIEIIDSKIEDKMIDKNLILKLSNNIKSWQKNTNIQNIQHYILIINKPGLQKIIYSKANSKFLKEIY